MSERSREKIALVVFVFLVVFAGCCLGGYLVAGHSWNVAASSIDDTFGSMEGYTAIVYEGTVDPRPAEASAAAGAAQDAKGRGDVGGALAGDVSDGSDAPGLAGDAPGAQDVDVAGALSDGSPDAASAAAGAAAGANAAAGVDAAADAAAGADVAIDVATGTGADAAAGAAADAAVADANDGAAAAGAAADDAAADASADAATGADAAADAASGSAVSASASAAKDPVTVEEARASYEEKNATVVTLDTAHIGTYRDGRILKKGDQRFGVFSVDEGTTLLQIKRHVKYFEEHEVDFVVALTSDKELLVGAASGIDIVISTQDENLFVMGETQDGTFFVDAPETGSVGVILISPSNVVSAKVIEEL